MRAVCYQKFGEAKKVLIEKEVKTPDPLENEIKVKIHTSSINPSDTKKRMGADPSLLNNGQVIPNSDGSGEIIALGKNVRDRKIGERVWLYNAQYGRQEGTSAEYICLPKEQVVWMPEHCSFEVGAMMGIPAMTAHRCVTCHGSVKDKTVLVTGGSGRVGYYAIQWAKYFGAKVIATASTPRSKEACEKAGADFITNHPSLETNEKILDFTKGKKIDLVVEGDFGVNLPFTLEVLKISGSIATYSSMSEKTPSIPFIKMMFMDLTINMVLVYGMPWSAKERAIQDISHILKNKSFHHRVNKTFPLSESIKAHEYLEEGNNLGSVILHMN